jgi:hypothetical protein
MERALYPFRNGGRGLDAATHTYGVPKVKFKKRNEGKNSKTGHVRIT